MFITMCILSGCDYLESIKGIGFKRAHKLIEENVTFDETLKALWKDNKIEVPDNYEENFVKAYLTFKF